MTEQERTLAMQERQGKLNEMRQQLSESIAQEKQTIQTQVAEARVTLDSESLRIAREIGERVLNRPVGKGEVN